MWSMFTSLLEILILLNELQLISNQGNISLILPVIYYTVLQNNMKCAAFGLCKKGL